MKKIAFLTALLLTSTATPAFATQYLITYSGTVIEGFDGIGEFGATNKNLMGQSYTIKYLYDTTRALAFINSYSLNSIGGYTYGVQSPLLSAILTIGSASISIGVDYSTQVSVYNDGRVAQQFVTTQTIFEDSLSSSNQGLTSNSRNFASYPGGPTASYTATLPDDAFSTYNHSNSGLETNGRDVTTYASMSPTKLTFSEVTNAVPEPATWAMMLVGFGMVAGATRYRRRATNVVFA